MAALTGPAGAAGPAALRGLLRPDPRALDGEWSWEDRRRLPAARQPRAARGTAGLARFLFEDFAHYFTARKLRDRFAVLIVERVLPRSLLPRGSPRAWSRPRLRRGPGPGPQVLEGFGDESEWRGSAAASRRSSATASTPRADRRARGHTARGRALGPVLRGRGDRSRVGAAAAPVQGRPQPGPCPRAGPRVRDQPRPGDEGRGAPRAQRPSSVAPRRMLLRQLSRFRGPRRKRVCRASLLKSERR